MFYFSYFECDLTGKKKLATVTFTHGTGLGDEQCRLGRNPTIREKRQPNVTFKSSRWMDSGPSGSGGKYLGLTGDTKLNQHSSGRALDFRIP